MDRLDTAKGECGRPSDERSGRKNRRRRSSCNLQSDKLLGEILPAEGHLFDLLEPEDVVPEWKRWSPILLRPEGLYGTRPAEGGNKAAKLRAIREALRTAKRVSAAVSSGFARGKVRKAPTSKKAKENKTH